MNDPIYAILMNPDFKSKLRRRVNGHGVEADDVLQSTWIPA